MWASTDELYHHGILGMKWGKRNGPPYPLSSDVSTGSRLKKTFVSGSSKTQDKNSGFYKKNLPTKMRRELDSKMKAGNTILVGDAPGIDRQTQDYLKKKNYKNVVVYSPGKESRYLADKNWKNKLVDDPKHEPGSPEWLAKKDKAMTKDADEGIAVVLPNGGAKATRNNIERLQKQNKPVSVYELKTGDPDFKKLATKGAAILKREGKILASAAVFSVAQNLMTGQPIKPKKMAQKIIAMYALSTIGDKAKLAINKSKYKKQIYVGGTALAIAATSFGAYKILKPMYATSGKAITDSLNLSDMTMADLKDLDLY